MAEKPLGRHGRNHRTERAEHDEAAIEQRYALFGKPHHDGLEPADEGTSDAKPDKAASDHKRLKSIGGPEQHGADSGDQQHSALDPPWSVAVHESAERQLDGGERQEIDRRHESEMRRIEAELRRQRSRQ